MQNKVQIDDLLLTASNKEIRTRAKLAPFVGGRKLLFLGIYAQTKDYLKLNRHFYKKILFKEVHAIKNIKTDKYFDIDLEHIHINSVPYQIYRSHFVGNENHFFTFTAIVTKYKSHNELRFGLNNLKLVEFNIDVKNQLAKHYLNQLTLYEKSLLAQIRKYFQQKYPKRKLYSKAKNQQDLLYRITDFQTRNVFLEKILWKLRCKKKLDHSSIQFFSYNKKHKIKSLNKKLNKKTYNHKELFNYNHLAPHYKISRNASGVEITLLKLNLVSPILLNQLKQKFNK